MRKKVYSDRKGRPEKIEKKNSKILDFLGMVLYCAVVVVIMFFVIKYVGQRTVVIGHSMETTLQDGDNLITDKITYRFKNPKRFDIIVFPYEENGKQLLIKRIIGMPGETVQIKDGYVYINNHKLSEHFCDEKINDPGEAANPIHLGEGEYFVLGDNRNNSKDSRFASVGNIKREEITGRAWIRLFPFDKIQLLKNTNE